MFTFVDVTKPKKKDPRILYEDTTKDFIVKKDGNPVAGITLDVKEDHIYVYEIKVFTTERRKGYGKQIIHSLFDKFERSVIKGASLETEEAYSFWHNLGAKFYYIEEEGYEDIYELIDSELMSPFVLEK